MRICFLDIESHIEITHFPVTTNRHSKQLFIPVQALIKTIIHPAEGQIVGRKVPTWGKDKQVFVITPTREPASFLWAV